MSMPLLAADPPIPVGQTPVDEFLQGLQTIDAGRLATLFLPHGQLHVGDNGPFIGQDSIRKAFARTLSRLIWLRAHVVSKWSRDGVVIVELDLSLMRDDGLALTMPLTIDLWINGFGIRQCRMFFYDEINPLLGK